MEIHPALEDKVTLINKMDCGRNKPEDTENIYTKKPFCCSKCSEAFAWASALKRHERLHTDKKPLACSKWDKRFSMSSSVTVHERIHTGEKQYKYSKCDSVIRTFQILLA